MNRNATKGDSMKKTSEIDVGSFVSIPAWEQWGMIVGIEPAMFGPESSIVILLQTDPDSDTVKKFRIEDGQFDWA